MDTGKIYFPLSICASKKKAGGNVARINIEDSLWSDDRFLELISSIGLAEAVGSWVLACKAAQKFWLKDKAMIPKDRALKLPHFNALCDSSFLIKKEAGYYFAGSENQFAWIVQRQNAGKKGGSSKNSNLQPSGAKREQAGAKREGNGSKPLTLTPTLTPKENKVTSNEVTTEVVKKSPPSADALSKFNAVSMEQVLYAVGQQKISGWMELYDQDRAWLDREFKKIWDYYAVTWPRKKPKSKRGWMAAMNSWLERGWSSRATKFKTSKLEKSQNHSQSLVDWVQAAETGGE